MENYNKVEKGEIGTYYYLDNELHRIDGPAIEWNSGSKLWYQNNKLHRINGPAIERVNGDKYWYYEGKEIDCESQEEFERLIKLRLFW